MRKYLYKKATAGVLFLAMIFGIMPISGFAASLDDRLRGLGLYEYYSLLPEVDRNEVAKALDALSGDDELTAEYKSAWDNTVFGEESTTRERVLCDRFETGIDNVWTKQKQPGTDDYKSLSSDGSETKAFYISGGAFGGANTYITADLGYENIFISMYFYETESEWSKSSFGIRVNDELTFGVYGTAEEYSINSGGVWKSSGVERAEGWHRLVFDNTDGMKIYIDGTNIFDGEGEVKYLQIGNLWNNSGIDEWFVDNVSVIADKEVAPLDKLNEDVCEDNIATVLEEKRADLFSKLPECDRKDIVSIMDKYVPYESLTKAKEQFEKALVSVTQYDSSKYGLVFSEDFSNGITSLWQSEKKPAINTFLSNTVDNLDISGAEQNAAAFWGASIRANNGEGSVTGEGQTIKRDIPKNAYVNLYFYDPLNDKTGTFGVKINDSVTVGSYAAASNYVVSKNGGSSWEEFSVAKAKGWHKITFDGVASADKIIVYFDGYKVAEVTGDTEYLEIGNPWSIASFSYYGVDNITVARKFVPQAQNVLIIDNKTSLEASYDYYNPGNIAEGNTEFQWYKKNVNNEFEVISGANDKVYSYDIPDDVGGTYRVKVTPVDKNGVKGDDVYSSEHTETYLGQYQPLVSNVRIEGEVYAGATVTVKYDADGEKNGGQAKYRWYVSKDGVKTELEGLKTGTVTLGADIVGGKVTADVSVEGENGSFSDWCQSEEVADTTTIPQMIKAVNSSEGISKNGVMLDLLTVLDTKFSGYTQTDKEKIVLKLVNNNNISSLADYNKIVSSVLNDKSETASLGGGSDSAKPIVNTTANTGWGSVNEQTKHISTNSFDDIDHVDWAVPAINSLSDKGVLKGKAQRLFCPDDKITRGEFITVLIRAFFGIDKTARQPFVDISDDDWFAPYAATAYKLGIANGKAGGAFGAYDNITREEMAVFCARTAKLGVCVKNEPVKYTHFSDETSISEYAYDSVVKMVESGFLNGVGDNRFAPGELSTRAMAAKLIYSMQKPDARLASNGSYVREDFEHGTGIFTGGSPYDELISEAVSYDFGYSGNSGLKILGSVGAYTKADGNMVFRVMMYDSTNKSGASAFINADGYGIGICSTSKSPRIENYTLLVEGNAVDAGVSRSDGWHEFIVDMSRVGYVDYYIDGVMVKTIEKEVVPEYVSLGNPWQGTGTVLTYLDEFIMAHTLDMLNFGGDNSYANGNRLLTDAQPKLSALPEKVREKAGLLHALKILSVNYDGSIDYEKNITVEEFMYLLCGMKNTTARLNDSSVLYLNNTDPKYAPFVGYAKEQGWLDSNLYKDAKDNVNLNYAIKFMLTLLGYGGMGEGKADEWWLEQATVNKLYDGVSGGDNLTMSDAIVLCYNTLMANVVEYDIVSYNKAQYTNSGKFDLLSLNFDVYYGEYTLNGVYGTELSSEHNLSEHHALLDNNNVLYYGTNLGEYVGMKLRSYIYADEDNGDTLIFAYDRGKSSKRTIAADDIYEIKKSGSGYVVENEGKQLKISDNPTVIYNGSYLFNYTVDNLKPEIGYIRCVDGDLNGTYEIVFVADYIPVKISGVDYETKIIYNEYDAKAYDLSVAEPLTSGFDTLAYVAGISNGQCLLLAHSADGKRADILAATETVTGIINSTKDKKVQIGDTTYKYPSLLKEYYDKKDMEGISAGVSGDFVIGEFGTVLGMDNAENSRKMFGYLIHTWSENEGEAYGARIYSALGNMATYVISDKAKINGAAFKSGVFLALSPQLVRYELKKDGKISSIETADESHQNSEELKGSDKFWLYRDADVWYRDNGYNFGMVMYITSQTPFMFVPTGENLNDYNMYSMGTASSFSNGQTFHYKAYNADEYNFPDIVVVETQTAGHVLSGNESPLFVVTAVVNETDDYGDRHKYLYGWEKGVMKSYVINDDIDFDAIKQSYGYTGAVSAGDTFNPYYNPKNEVIDMRNITHMAGSEDKYTDMSKWNFVMDNSSCCYAMIESYGRALKITDGAHSCIIKSPERIYVYHRSSQLMMTGTSEDLIKGRDIAVRTCHGNTREVIVYVD